MGKIQFCLALVACVLATSTISALINLEGIVENIQSGNNASKNLTNEEIEISNALQTAISYLDNAVDVVNNYTIVIVQQLTGAVNTAAVPGNITKYIVSSLLPQIGEIIKLTNVLRNIPKAETCALNTTFSQVSKGVINGISEAVQCTRTVKSQLNSVAQSISSTPLTAVNFTVQVLSNVNKCVSQSGNSNAFSCIIQLINRGVETASNSVTNTTTIINEASRTALAVPACTTDVVARSLNKGNGVIKSIVECAKDLGVDVALPKLSGILPNFTAIINRAKKAIANATETLVGPNGPIKALSSVVNRVEKITSVGTEAINVAVNKSVGVVREAIRQISQSVANSSVNINVDRCVSNALNSATELQSKGVELINSCINYAAMDATLFVSQAVATDIKLKTELATAGMSAVTHCFGDALKLEDAIDKCVETIFTELEMYVAQRRNEVNSLVVTGEGLIDRVGGCVPDGVTILDQVGQSVVYDLRACLGV